MPGLKPAYFYLKKQSNEKQIKLYFVSTDNTSVGTFFLAKPGTFYC